MHRRLCTNTNPLAAPGILKFDLGTMVIMGLIIGAIATLISVFVYTKIHDKGFLMQKKRCGIKMREIYVEEDLNENQKVPGFFVSFTSICFRFFAFLLELEH